MTFFKWLKWVFSKRLSINIENCTFEGVNPDSFYTKNGVFYEYNVRYSVKNCIFNEYKEPEPNVVKFEVNLTQDYNNIWIGSVDRNKEEFRIIPADEPLPFNIVYTKEPILSDQEKEDQRTERFIDSMVMWSKRI